MNKNDSADKPAWQCEYTEAEKQRIEAWNKTVNRIRVHYGLEPFPEKGDSES